MSAMPSGRLVRHVFLAFLGAASCGCAARPDPRALGPALESGLGAAADGAHAAARPVIRQQDPEDSGLFSLDALENLAPSRVFDDLRQRTPWRRDEARGSALLAEAESLFREAKYHEAAARAKSAAFTWPDSTIEEDALFLLGECQFFTDQYPKANDTYANLLTKYQNTRHLDKVMNRQFAIARYWQELDRAKPIAFLNPNFTDRSRPILDTTGNALATYESVRLNDPTGPLADDSVMATANAYFLDDRYMDADYYYGLLRSEYPRSEHLLTSFQLGLRSKLLTYQGPQYDPKSLNEAEGLVDQMLTQFPDELGQERQRLLETRQEIREKQAERDWHMAEYYGRNKYFGAVRYYCEKIVREHPETKTAQLARQRLEEIKDLPPNPPQRLKWLVDLLEEDD
jgi:outer membrane protein assembly factor BamD (BamD/ComL family)